MIGTLRCSNQFRVLVALVHGEETGAQQEGLTTDSIELLIAEETGAEALLLRTPMAWEPRPKALIEAIPSAVGALTTFVIVWSLVPARHVVVQAVHYHGAAAGFHEQYGMGRHQFFVVNNGQWQCCPRQAPFNQSAPFLQREILTVAMPQDRIAPLIFLASPFKVHSEMKLGINLAIDLIHGLQRLHVRRNE